MTQLSSDAAPRRKSALSPTTPRPTPLTRSMWSTALTLAVAGLLLSGPALGEQSQKHNTQEMHDKHSDAGQHGAKASHSNGQHDHHEKFEVTDAALAPSVRIDVVRDEMAGWNLRLIND